MGNLSLLLEVSGESRGVRPRWLIGVFLAGASVVREENALMSYGFLSPKACGDVGSSFLPFFFRQPHMAFLTAVPA